MTHFNWGWRSCVLAVLLPVLAAPSSRTTVNVREPAGNDSARSRGMQVPPTDAELHSIVERAIQKVVFGSLNEVSLYTSLQVWPGSGASSELNEATRRDLTDRLERLGLKVVDADISKRPILALNVVLVRLPNSKDYIAYYLELALREKVELNRPSEGTPPATTYSFHTSGQFTTANVLRELKTAYNALLDSLQQALEVARQAP